MKIIVTQHASELIIFTGGGEKTPKRRVLSMPVDGNLDALDPDLLLDITPRQLLAIRIAISNHKSDIQKEKISAAVEALQIACQDISGVVLSQDVTGAHIAVIDAAKRSLKRALVKKRKGGGGTKASRKVGVVTQPNALPSEPLPRIFNQL